jgi:hypothetical protein
MCTRLKASFYHHIQYRIAFQLARYSIFLYFAQPFPYCILGGQAFAGKQAAGPCRTGGPFPPSFPADPTLPPAECRGGSGTLCHPYGTAGNGVCHTFFLALGP